MARASQVAVVAAAAASSGVFVLGLPTGDVALPPEKAELPVIETPTDANVARVFAPADKAGLARRFSQIANNPKAPEPPPAQQPVATPTPPPQPTGESAYFGLAQIGGKRMALLRREGRQRFYALGAKLGEATITAIEDDHVTLSDGKRIERSERTGESVTRARSNSPNAALARLPALQTVPGMTAGMPQTQGAWQDPTYSQYLVPGDIPSEEVAAWRKVRAMMLADPQYLKEDMQMMAMKRLDQTRSELGKDYELTDTELMREQYYLRTGSNPAELSDDELKEKLAEVEQNFEASGEKAKKGLP
jgi:hypothetical protein